MTKVEALIRPRKLDEVKTALTEICVRGMTITEAFGSGKLKGAARHFRGVDFTANFDHEVKLEIVAQDADARPIADAIVRAARTGLVGDGNVFRLPVCDAIRIRTGEEGAVAIS